MVAAGRWWRFGRPAGRGCRVDRRGRRHPGGLLASRR